MTIQRQYSLPNCTLVLEGLGNGAVSLESRPLMSILVNAQCRFLGAQEQILTGGREFFESLIKAVHAYSQSLMSGLEPANQLSGPVQLKKITPNQHRLSVTGPTTEQAVGTATVDLSTVQLFDLVEAIDQFLVDQQTLPDLPLEMAPLSKRAVRSQGDMAKQSAPAALGLSGLALAGALAFLAPQPKVNQPQELFPSANSGNTVDASASPSPAPSATAPSAVTASASPSSDPNAVPSSDPNAAPSADPNAAPSADPNADPNAALTADQAKLEGILSQAPAITDAGEIEAAAKAATEKIEQAWKTRTGLPENLTYRLGVAKDGTLLGYKSEGDAALNNVKLTPLTDLVYTQSANEPLAQFRATFTKDGKLELTPIPADQSVSPPDPAASASPNP